MSSLHMTSRICSDKYLSSTRCAEPRTPPAIQNCQVLSAHSLNLVFFSFKQTQTEEGKTNKEQCSGDATEHHCQGA